MRRRSRSLSPSHMRAAIAAVLVVAACLLTVLCSALPARGAEYDIAELGWIDGEESSLTIAGKPYTPGMKVEYGDELKFALHWNVPDSVTIHDGDTFVYALPPSIAFNEGEQYPFTDENGTASGTFAVTDGRLVMTYHREDGASAGTNVKAFVTAQGSVTQTMTGGGASGGNTSVSFPGFGEINVDIEPKHELKSHKSGAISTDDPTVFDFVIDVVSTGTNSGVTVEDTMGSLLTLSDQPIRIYTDPQCTQLYTGSWQESTHADHAFALTIDHMADETLYVRYAVVIDRSDVSEAVANSNWQVVNNTATYSSIDHPQQDSTSQGLWLSSNWYVNKQGSTTQEEPGLITWTVTVVPDEGSQAPVYIQDLPGNGLTAASTDVHVECRHSRHWDANPDQRTISWNALTSQDGKTALPVDDDGNLYTEYVFTYTTRAQSVPETGSGEKISYTNQFTVTPSDRDPIAATGTVTLGSEAVSLHKQYAGEATETSQFPWTVQFEALENLPAGSTLVDTVDAQYHRFSGTVSVYTDETFTTPYDRYTATFDEAKSTMTVAFSDPIPQGTKLYVSYTTVANAGVIVGSSFTNTATMLHRSATASHTPVTDNMTKGNRYWYDQFDGSVPSRDNLLRWELNVHDVPQSAQSVTITDVPGSGQTFVTGSVKAIVGWNTLADGVTATVQDDGSITFTLEPHSDAFNAALTKSGVTIVYDTTFTDLRTAQAGNYGNKATIIVDGLAQPSDEASVWATPQQVIRKTNMYNQATAPYIRYTVAVNPSGTLLDNGHTLVLSDTLGTALEPDLDPQSVSIEDTATGAEIIGASYAYDPTTKQLTFRVPDGQAITISYRAKVLLAPGEEFGSLATNTIELVGFPSSIGKDDSTPSTKIVQEALAGITSNRYALQVYKYADGDATKPLNGAQFTITPMEVANQRGTDWVAKEGTPIITDLATATTGYTTTVAVNADTIYRITETEPPEGYTDGYSQTDPPSIYVVFPSSAAPEHGYGDVTINGHPLKVAVAKNGDQTVTLQTFLWNVSNTGDIRASFTLNKTDAQGNPLEGAQFTLTRDGDASFTTKTCTSGADGVCVTFENLAPGSYTLTETQVPDGYHAIAPKSIVVSTSGAVLVDGELIATSADKGTTTNRLTVTNTKDEEEHPNPTRMSVTITKRWEDSHDKDQLRDGVRVLMQLRANGEIVPDSTVELNASNHWTHDWTGLDRTDSNGHDIIYTVTETLEGANADQYHATTVRHTIANGVDVTIYNIHQPNATNLTIHKKWDDANNQDGLRPSFVSITLYGTAQCAANTGTQTDSPCTDQLLTARLRESNGTQQSDGTWEWILENIPTTNAAGHPYTYTLTEEPVDGYDSQIRPINDGNGNQSGYELTNTHTPEVTTVTVKKQWDDGTGATPLHHPDTVTVWLLSSVWEGSNGWPVPQESQCGALAQGRSCVVLGGVNGDLDGTHNEWTATFTNLPKYHHGTLIRYSVTEEFVDGYEPSLTALHVTTGDNGQVTVANDSSFQLTNTAVATPFVLPSAGADEWRESWWILAVTLLALAAVFGVLAVRNSSTGTASAKPSSKAGA